MMPWRKREAEAAQHVESAKAQHRKAEADHETAQRQSERAKQVARELERQGRKNGWMEDLLKIMGTGA